MTNPHQADIGGEMRRNGTSINWSGSIRTIQHGLKPVIHQSIEVFDGRVHVLTFKGISNPVLYDHWGNTLAQVNKEYLSTNLELMRQNAYKQNERLAFDIENY